MLELSEEQVAKLESEINEVIEKLNELEPKLNSTYQERSRIKERADSATNAYNEVQRAVTVQMTNLEKLKALLKEKGGRKNMDLAKELEDLLTSGKASILNGEDRGLSKSFKQSQFVPDPCVSEIDRDQALLKGLLLVTFGVICFNTWTGHYSNDSTMPVEEVFDIMVKSVQI